MRSVSLTCLLLLAPAMVLANAGPYRETEATAFGQSGVRAATEITLRREKLRMEVTGTERYQVHAEYGLENPGKATTLPIGVPLLVFDSPYRSSDDREKEAAGRLAAAAEGIRLQLNAQNYRCRAKELPASSRATGWVSPDRLPDSDGWWNQDEGVSEYRVAWCVVDMTFPAGASTMVLSYEAELLFRDASFEFSDILLHGDRLLLYPLFPAAGWKGTVGTLDIEVDLGELAAHAEVVAPAEPARRGQTLTWSLKNADLERIRSVAVLFRTVDYLHFRQMGTWNRMHPLRTAPRRVRASSSLKGHPPEHLADGNPETAWCAGKAGAWVEIEFVPRAGDRMHGQKRTCRWDQLGVLPGWTASQKTFLDHGRITGVRLSGCGRKRPFKERSVPLAERFDHGAVELPESIMLESEMDDPTLDEEVLGLWRKDHYCLRVTVSDTQAGKAHGPPCISELVPVMGCTHDSMYE